MEPSAPPGKKVAGAANRQVHLLVVAGRFDEALAAAEEMVARETATEATVAKAVSASAQKGAVDGALAWYARHSEMGLEPHVRSAIPIIKIMSMKDDPRLHEFMEKEFVAKFAFKAMPAQVDQSFRRYLKVATDPDRIAWAMDTWVTLSDTLDMDVAASLRGPGVDTKLMQRDGANLGSHRLPRIDPTPESIDAAMRSIYFAVGEFSRAKDMTDFAKFVDETPFDVVVDALNVGFGGSNAKRTVPGAKKTNEFNEDFLHAAVRSLVSNGMAPLVVIPRYMKLRKKYPSPVLIYSTNTHKGGSLSDDHFWLYAALAKPCFFVSNDFMRDHLVFWGDLRPQARFFAERSRIKWISGRPGALSMPDLWTATSHRSDDSSTPTWFFPIAGDARMWIRVSAGRPGSPW